MQPITIKEAEKLSSPNPFALVVTCDDTCKQNLMALSWWTYASNNPPTVAICLSGRGHSHTLIDGNGMFSLCLPDDTIAEAAFKCGTRSGRDTDKAAEFGIELIPANEIAPMLVARSKVAMECKVVSAAEAGDHILYIANVVAVHANPDVPHLMCENGYGALKAY